MKYKTESKQEEKQIRKQTRKTNKPKLRDTEQCGGYQRERGGQGGVEEGKEDQIHGERRRLDFGCWAHKRIYR